MGRTKKFDAGLTAMACALALVFSLVAFSVVAPAFAQLGMTVNVPLQYATIVGWGTPTPRAAQATATPPRLTGEAAKITELRTQLTKGKNFILQAELKMLERKHLPSTDSTPSSSLVSWGWNSDESSVLHIDLYGGFPGTSAVGTNAFDVITGQRAIDESLQLGSIDTETRNNPEAQLLRNVENNIESYKNARGNYPAALKDFATNPPPTNRNTNNSSSSSYYSSSTYLNNVWYNGKQDKISNLAKKFTYQRSKDGKTFTLKLVETGQQTFPLSDIKPLQIKTHPWTEMLVGKNVAVSPIFSLVPADHFVVQFSDPKKVTELEQVLQKIGGTAEFLTAGQRMTHIIEKISERLGIQNPNLLLTQISELAFISEDLDFYPKTHYALALMPKVGMEIAGPWSAQFSSPQNHSAQVGDYLVISTSQRLLDAIQAAAENKRPSLASAKDFSYMLSQLDSRREGLTYLSESFITKLVGPDYRIKARRRNAIVPALETLQYVVFAYRDLKGIWPRTIRQIANEGYLNAATIKNIDDYRVDAQGWVVHKDWGSIKELRGVNDVALATITRSEKLSYEEFRDGYQNFWREFFDPIGVGIIVSDQISAHTIILPLIDESTYNAMAEIFGGDPITFDFLLKPNRVPALQVVAKLNDLTPLFYGLSNEFSDEKQEAALEQKFNAILKPYGIDPQTLKDEDCFDAERTCRQVIAEKYPKMNAARVINDIRKIKKDFVREAMNTAAKDWLELDTPIDIFGVIGNEVTVSLGAQSSMEDLNFFGVLGSMDMYAGLKLNNPDQAKTLLNKFFRKVAAEESGNQGTGFGGILTPSNTRPSEKVYHGVAYASLPTDFINVSYLFLNNRFYLALGEKTIQRVIDEALAGATKPTADRYSQSIQRGMAYIGNAQNLALHVDLNQYLEMQKELTQQITADGAAAERLLMPKISYLREALTLAKSLPGYDGTLKNVHGVYYKNIPSPQNGYGVLVSNGAIYLEIDNKRYDLDTTETTVLDQSMTGVVEALKKEYLGLWSTFKNVSIGLKLTEAGLDSRVAISNPLQTTLDPRFPSPTFPSPEPIPTVAPSPETAQITAQPTPVSPSTPFPQTLAIIIAIAGGFIILLGGGVIVWLLLRSRSGGPPSTPPPPDSTDLPPPDEPTAPSPDPTTPATPNP